MNGQPAWDVTEGASQAGRTALVTGSNGGVGLEVARAIASMGGLVYLACRNVAAATHARADILGSCPRADVRILHVDQSSLDSVHQFVDEFRAKAPALDVLINNAGVMHRSRVVTVDGFEGDLGTNFLGAFALTGLLLDMLMRAPASRIVAVSSKTHRSGRINFDDLHMERSFDMQAAYTQSKLAQLLTTFELQRRLAAVGSTTIALAAHPGGSRTAILRKQNALMRAVYSPRFRYLTGWFTQSPAAGALPIVRAATDVHARGGEFYGPGGRFEYVGPAVQVRAAPRAHDRDTQARLWSAAEGLTGVTYALPKAF